MLDVPLWRGPSFFQEVAFLSAPTKQVDCLRCSPVAHEALQELHYRALLLQRQWGKSFIHCFIALDPRKSAFFRRFRAGATS